MKVWRARDITAIEFLTESIWLEITMDISARLQEGTHSFCHLRLKYRYVFISDFSRKLYSAFQWLRSIFQTSNWRLIHWASQFCASLRIACGDMLLLAFAFPIQGKLFLISYIFPSISYRKGAVPGNIYLHERCLWIQLKSSGFF